MDDLGQKRILKELAAINKMLSSLDKTVALQEQNLREHMRRTDLLEQKLAPVEQHVEQVKGVGKFIGILALLATIATIYFAAKGGS